MTRQEHISREDSEQVLIDELLEAGVIDSASLERAIQVARGEGDPVWQILPRLGLMSEEQLAKTMAKAFGMKLVLMGDFPKELPFRDKISRRFLMEHQVLPLGEKKGVVQLAVADPDCDYALRAVEQALDSAVTALLASPADIAAKLEEYFAEGISAMARITTGEDAGPARLSDDLLDVLRDSASGAPVVKLVNLIIERAVTAGASDIHIEPFENNLVVRYRIDGVLQAVESPPPHMSDAIISRIKLLSNLNIAERRLPQDGRAKMAVRGTPIDMRVSTMPALFGESVVLRILDQSSVALDLAGLGFTADDIQRIEKLVHRPSGIVLAVGPTGSGKTTTLYAALNLINTVDRKILTVEDPVEYQIQGIVQSQVKPGIGLDFANVLRSLLRQDPDIIMVGEIRDTETAEIAVQAALTGHTVFSTLHTNSAIATVTRLVDMGIEPFLLGATLGGIVAQRLVRRLCPECREPTKVDRAALGATDIPELPKSGQVKLWRAKGCAACHQTGYRGRTVICEILEISEELQHALSQFKNENDLAGIVRKDGFRSLFNSGIAKVLSGETSLEEILRVTLEK